MYGCLFIFGIFALYYWPDNESAALTAFSFLALWGYSKFSETWHLEDKIELLEESKKIADINDKLAKLRRVDEIPISVRCLMEKDGGLVAYTLQTEKDDDRLGDTKDVPVSIYDSHSEIADKVWDAYQNQGKGS